MGHTLQAVEHAKELAELELVKQFAGDAERFLNAFPDIKVIGAHTINNGACGTHTERAVIGRWHEFMFAAQPTGFAIVDLCGCCGQYSIRIPQPMHARSAADVARFDDIEPSKTLTACFDCRWVIKNYERAAKASSRFARWRFEHSYGQPAERVISRYRVLNVPAEL